MEKKRERLEESLGDSHRLRVPTGLFLASDEASSYRCRFTVDGGLTAY